MYATIAEPDLVVRQEWGRPGRGVPVGIAMGWSQCLEASIAFTLVLVILAGDHVHERLVAESGVESFVDRDPDVPELRWVDDDDECSSEVKSAGQCARRLASQFIELISELSKVWSKTKRALKAHRTRRASGDSHDLDWLLSEGSTINDEDRFLKESPIQHLVDVSEQIRNTHSALDCGSLHEAPLLQGSQRMSTEERALDRTVGSPVYCRLKTVIDPRALRRYVHRVVTGDLPEQ